METGETKAGLENRDRGGIVEFRLHGRGGQGIVVAASIFAEAVFLGGRYARAFSLFGAERRGAPVTAFIRAGTDILMPRSRVYYPDFVVIFDQSLGGPAVFSGLKENGIVLVNTADGDTDILARDDQGGDQSRGNLKLYTVDATSIAGKHGLTAAGFPLVNTVMLGAMARVSGTANMEHMALSIKKRISVRLEANVRAVQEGFESVKEVGGVAT